MGESNTGQAASPVIDWKRMDELRTLQMPGEPDLVLELFAVFQKTSKAHLPALSEIAKTNDLAKLFKEAHSFKSGARTIGAVRLGDACRDLEIICEGNQGAKVAEAIEKIQAEYQALLSAIEKFASGSAT